MLGRTQCAPVAQWIERWTSNPSIARSTRVRGAIFYCRRDMIDIQNKDQVKEILTQAQHLMTFGLPGEMRKALTKLSVASDMLYKYYVKCEEDPDPPYDLRP